MNEATNTVIQSRFSTVSIYKIFAECVRKVKEQQLESIVNVIHGELNWYVVDGEEDKCMKIVEDVYAELLGAIK